MQLKKITTFTLLAIVLIICSLSTISAATYSITNSTSDGGIRTALNGATPGDIIELAEGTYTGNNNTNMTINKNITIQGKTKDKVILDAQGLSRIFTINNNLNVTFINITFLNAYFTGNGGAIYNYFDGSRLNLINCSFDNNQVTGDGGAIFNAGSYSSIINCNFSNNQATTGGSIRLYGSLHDTSIINCTFTNNQATTGGGAIHNPGSSYNNSINNCTFINNTATYGGAIRNSGLNHSIINCIFINNSATNYGGAIANIDTSGSSSSSQFVFNCIFINNSANYGGATSNMYDGNRPANQSLTNCTFINNSATYGGAVFNDIGCNLTVSNNTMSGNVAGLGQMIYNNGSIGILNLTYIDNSTLTVLNGSTITIYATLTDDMGNTVTGQNIRIYINGILGGTLIQNIESIEGYVSFNLTVLGEDGDLFPVNGTYDGIGDYPLIINEGLISVFAPYNITKIATNSTISTKNVTVGKPTNITGIATDENGNILANIELSVIVDGKTYTVTTNSNGEWTLTYIPTKTGNLDVSVLWKGNDTHNGFTNKGILNVAKRNIIVTITIEENDDGSITIIANATYEDDGSPVINNPVDFILDGRIIGTGITNKNGIAKLKVPANKINDKTHKITVLVHGDDNSNGGKATSNFTRKTLDSPKLNNTNKTINNPAVKTSAAMKQTGILINLIILVLLSCLGIAIRKK